MAQVKATALDDCRAKVSGGSGSVCICDGTVSAPGTCAPVPRDSWRCAPLPSQPCTLYNGARVGLDPADQALDPRAPQCCMQSGSVPVFT
eukprot:scaffold29486_cov110-Isochrysis_galbana.AAC.4